MKKEYVKNFVSKRIVTMGNSLESGKTKADLAQLRRGVGKKPGELPELWGMIFKDLPEELMSKGSEPSYAEWAIYTALTLFAIHQQGNLESVHSNDDNARFGRAVRKLVHDEDGEERIRFKLSVVALSDDMAELSYRMKTVTRLLSAESIKLNYVDLADDLYTFQFESMADSVRLKWAQDFYRMNKSTEEGKENNNEE